MGETWETSAACRNHTDLFHSPYIDYSPKDHTFLGLPGTPAEALAKQEQVRTAAKKVCAGCSVSVECAMWALQNTFYGIAAGMTPDEAADSREQHDIKVNEITSAQMAEYAGVAEDHGGRRILQAAQVMPLVEDGWTNRQIAAHFGVSTRTVIRVRVENRVDVEIDADETVDTGSWATEETIEDVAFDIVDNMRAAAREAALLAPVDQILASPADADVLAALEEIVTDATPIVEYPTGEGVFLSGPDAATLGTAPASEQAQEMPAVTAPSVSPRASNSPMLDGKEINPGRLSPFMVPVWTLLTDGEWHHLDEIVAVAAPYITLEEAKSFTSHTKSNGMRSWEQRDPQAGARAKVKNAVQAAVRIRGNMERDDEWYRATKKALASFLASQNTVAL